LPGVIGGLGGFEMLLFHAAWVLTVTFALSIAYEAWRTLARRHVSTHDSPAAFLKGLPIYVVALAVIVMMFLAVPGANWIGLVLSLAGIGVSIFYYNPTIMMARAPGVIDWIEDMVFTGLLFVAAAILVYDIAGFTLS
jgi:phosphatidylserine synthase